MQQLHIAIDARLPDSGQGGVLSVVKAMAQAFHQFDDSTFRRTWVVMKQSGWWRSTLPQRDDVIELSMPTTSVATKFPAVTSRLAPTMLKILGDRNYLDERLITAGVDVVHLPYQDGVLTELPFAYFPHDLQHQYLSENFTASQIRHRETRWKKRALSATRVVVAGEHVKRDLVDFWGVPQEKVLVYAFPPPIKRLANKSISTPLRNPYVIYPAVFWPHKNHQSLISAMSILKSRGSLLNLLLTGAKNATFTAILRQIKELGLTNQVHYVGHVDEADLDNLIARSEAVVLPSLFEAVSLTAFDAIRAERPLVCSDREFFRAQCGNRAQYFDPLDPISIANEIEAVIQQNHLGNHISALSNAMIKQLSLEVFAENLYKTYQSCITESSP